MPPFVPHKRPPSPKAPPPPKRRAVENARPAPPADPAVAGSDSDSSLSDAPSSDAPRGDDSDANEDASDDDAVDWEDAMDTTTPTAPTPLAAGSEAQDLELTLNKNEAHVSDLLDGKKGPTKIERQIRIQTHCMHVQCLLLHNALRNAWLNDPKVHDTLRRRLPAGLHKECQKWRVASGLEVPEERTEDKSKKKGKQSQSRDRNWGDGSSRLEPGQPDMSRGDPVLHLLKVLAAYWKKQFKITAPGLRKHGYRPTSLMQAEISSFHNEEHDPERHGERICGIDEFRSAAECMEGSRDVGAQLFTALLRALGVEARLVASLQPLGFGWTKSEAFTQRPTRKEPEKEAETELELLNSDSDEDLPPSNNPKGYDLDLPFPVYWAEVASPVTHEIIPVDPLVLSNAVAATPELQAYFEPRGAKAEKAKQVICYVVAYSSDKTAKDVTTRYLRRRTWPGKTKGYRLPVEKIPIPGRKGKFYEYDWFRVNLRAYEREEKKKTLVDDIEDAKDLLPNQPDKKPAKEGDTLQSLRSSPEFVLERFLRREEALRPGSKHVRTFVSGKGAKAKEEKVYRRADVLRCLSAESWHKEGRQIKVGETPLKRVPIRAVTLLRKREVDELERSTGEKPKQGLYAKHQTEYIIPPPIRDGVIPKNDYGNIDCFVPRMVPQGASHVPWPGTVRVCKKLGIDFAEAVTGFEFGSKMAVPVIEGVVVARENADLLRDAWLAEEAEKRKKEQLKAEKLILQTWRKFLFGLRIAERVREEYGSGTASHDTEREAHNPFSSRRPADPAPRPPREDPNEDPIDRGGGFLLPGADDGDDGGLVVERHDRHGGQSCAVSGKEDEPPDSDADSVEGVSPPPLSDSEAQDSNAEDQPRTRRRTRGTKGKN
ncbi:hypothetical protein PHISP_01105 [Aspergillus sp. HF37]|nr:hypothetical protein PHISP_01105 [Aspergillus sp. HF37]